MESKNNNGFGSDTIMGFEKFEDSGRGRGGSTQPKISLRKSNSIGINSAALEEFFEDDDEAVVMYYDEDENQVGMKPVKDKDEDGAYTLTRSESGGSVAPSAFIKNNGLTVERTMQFSPRKVDVNQNLSLVAFTASEGSEDFIAFYGSEDEDSED